jgi:acetyl-CoA carboxylase carboxyltransferase component
LSWQPEVDEIKRRVELAKQMGGAANVARQHDNGRLTVRERLDRLLCDWVTLAYDVLPQDIGVKRRGFRP